MHADGRCHQKRDITTEFAVVTDRQCQRSEAASVNQAGDRYAARACLGTKQLLAS